MKIKNKLLIGVLSFAVAGMVFNSCLEPEDLLTSSAKTGGIVEVVTSNVPYKLGATPTVPINLIVPKGPGIASIKVYNEFYNVVTKKASNQVLLTTVNVDDANTADDVAKQFSVTYASLIAGLLVDGAQLPVNEAANNIGDYWTLSYVSVTSDGREVINNATTTIGVANQYAGYYQCTGIFTHPTAGPRPINEKKFLKAISASKSLTALGDLGSAGYDIYIDVQGDNSCIVTKGVTCPTDVFMMPGLTNAYNPTTKVFTLNYFYVGGTGNRVITETYTPIP